MYRKKFKAYTDGSCDNLNPIRPGGAAYIIMDNKENIVLKKSKGFINTTNNRMELLAIMSVVNTLPPNSFVTIHTDSEYCIKACLSKSPKKNLDQLERYHSLCKSKNISVHFVWVKGHSDDYYNNMADNMANTEYQNIKEKYPKYLTAKRKSKSNDSKTTNRSSSKSRRRKSR